eukprot:31320-Pelagococcus_subviridis.AAC.3
MGSRPVGDHSVARARPTRGASSSPSPSSPSSPSSSSSSSSPRRASCRPRASVRVATTRARVASPSVGLVDWIRHRRRLAESDSPVD